jgi:hypothetical protein
VPGVPGSPGTPGVPGSPGKGPDGSPILVGDPGVPGAEENPGKEGVPKGTVTDCPGIHCPLDHWPGTNWLFTQSPGTN